MCKTKAALSVLGFVAAPGLALAPPAEPALLAWAFAVGDPIINTIAKPSINSGPQNFTKSRTGRTASRAWGLVQRSLVDRRLMAVIANILVCFGGNGMT